MTMIFFDGSERKVGKNFVIGAGVVIVERGLVRECQFQTVLPRSGFAETVAFWHVLSIMPFSELNKARLFTDDEIVGRAKEALYDGNYAGKAKERLLTHFDAFTNLFGSDRPQHFIQALKHLDIQKVKGHADIVYNERADYLAKCANDKSKTVAPYEQWVLEPKKYWDTEKECYAEKQYPFTS